MIGIGRHALCRSNWKRNDSESADSLQINVIGLVIVSEKKEKVREFCVGARLFGMQRKTAIRWDGVCFKRMEEGYCERGSLRSSSAALW